MSTENKTEEMIDQETESQVDATAETLADESAQEQAVDVEPTNREAEYLQKLQYAQAEFQNYKKRQEKRMADYHEFSQRNFILKLLPVLDDFDILFSHNNGDEEHVSLQGVKFIQNKLMAILSEMGLSVIESEGKLFDPNHHDAVLMEEAEQVEEGTILKVWQQGYMHKEALLRPAKVVTAKAKVNEAENAGE